MVRGCAAALDELDAAMGICGRGGDGSFKIAPTDMVRAGTGDEDATGAEHLESAEVEFLVAAECAFDGAPGFGEGGRVEDDEVIGLTGVGPLAQDLKGVAFDPVDRGGEAGAVGGQVALGDFKRGAAGVNAGDLAADLGKMKGEAALIGADIEGADARGRGGGG